MILSQREGIEEKFRRERIVERETSGEKLKNKYLRYPNILAILGVRRCGKWKINLFLADFFWGEFWLYKLR